MDMLLICMDGHAVGHVWMDMLSDMYGWTCCRTCMDGHAVGHVWMDMLLSCMDGHAADMYGWTCCRTCMNGHAVDMYGWSSRNNPVYTYIILKSWAALCVVQNAYPTA